MKTFFISLFFLVPTIVLGFDVKEDSLKNVFSQLSDDNQKLNVLNELSILFLRTDNSKLLHYGNQIVNLAKKSKNDYYLAMGYLKLSRAHSQLNNYVLVVKYLRLSRKIILNIHSKALEAEYYSALSLLNFYQNKYDSSIYNRLIALSIYKRLSKKKEMVATYIGLGSAAYMKGDYEKAIRYNLQGLQIAEKNHYKQESAALYGNLGVQYHHYGNHKKAIEYQFKSYYLSKKLEDKALMSNSLNNLGTIYAEKKKYIKSIIFQNKAIELYKELGNLAPYSNALNKVALNYLNLKDLDKAIKFNKDAQINAIKCNSKYVLANTYITASEIYQVQKNYNKAIDNGKMGLQIALSINAKSIIQMSYDKISKLYEELHNHQLALANYKLAVVYSDSMKNEAGTHQINELQAKYESDKKNNEIKNLSQKAAIQQLELKQRNIYIISLIGFVVLVGLLAVLLVWQIRLRAKQRNATLQNKLLQMQMNPHFIFHALTAIQNFILSHDATKASNYLTRFARLMRKSLEDSREERILLDKEVKAIEDYLEIQKLRLNNELEYKIEIDPELEEREVLIPPMFIQPIVENAIEHGIWNLEDKGILFIRFKQENNLLLFEIEDNGVGREKAAQLKEVHQKQSTSTAIKINSERLALLNTGIYKELTIMDLIDNNTQVVGTKVRFYLPLKFGQLKNPEVFEYSA